MCKVRQSSRLGDKPTNVLHHLDNQVVELFHVLQTAGSLGSLKENEYRKAIRCKMATIVWKLFLPT